MGKVERIKQDRATLLAKIREAHENKPSAAGIDKRGLTAEEIATVFGKGKSPVPRRRVRNDKKGGLRKQNRRDSIQRRHEARQLSGKFNPPPYKEIQYPDWFRSTGKADVSIVIPLFKSAEVITNQIKEWDLSNDGLKKEIIYVDDACPQSSFEKVISAWNLKQEQWKRRIGRIILHSKNAGFPFSCNNGAHHATGDYFLFLNADTIVTPRWIKPMYHIFKNDPSIGIVGNLHLKGDRKQVDSCGSEWGGKFFDHIGKDIYQGKRLKDGFTIENLPPDLLMPAERQMVTGACFMVSREAFDRVGGFDTSYRIGYWEDADFCLRVRMAGYKIFYQPKSTIYHIGRHSQPGNNPFTEHNKRKFYRDWVDTGALNLLNSNFGKPRKIKKHKSVIYTAITKGYDILQERQNTKSGKFVAFLEEHRESKTWEIRALQTDSKDSNRNAKKYKVLSHRFFPEFEYSLWIDGNVRLVGMSVDELIDTFLFDAEMAVFVHPERNCIYREAKVCKTRRLDETNTIDSQITRYRQEGYPTGAGLCECTILLRKNTPTVKEFNELWWAEICGGSKRDQISFPYVLRKSRVKYVYFPHNLRETMIFEKISNHNRQR